jgi:hypothetical protein
LIKYIDLGCNSELIKMMFFSLKTIKKTKNLKRELNLSNFCQKWKGIKNKKRINQQRGKKEESLENYIKA